MEKFIEVHSGFDRYLVNLNHVYEVMRGLDGCAFIHFAFQEKESIEGEYIKADESYEEVKRMIMGDCNG